MLEALDSISRYYACVASFTEEGDQLSQWRGYCEVGNGYSLGFDALKLKTMAEEQSYYLVPCIYEEAEHRLMAKELVNLTSVVNIQRNPNYGKPPFYEMSFSQAALFLAPLLKSESFKDEKEWRLIGVHPIGENTEFRLGNYSLIPYWEFDLSIADSLREIIIGPTPEPELSERAAMSLCTKKKIGGPFKISHSRIPYRKV